VGHSLIHSFISTANGGVAKRYDTQSELACIFSASDFAKNVMYCQTRFNFHSRHTKWKFSTCLATLYIVNGFSSEFTSLQTLLRYC